MNWYTRTISKAEGGLEGVICDELLAIGMARAQPPPFDIYMTKPRIAPPLDLVTIYFPPEAVDYCSGDSRQVQL